MHKQRYSSYITHLVVVVMLSLQLPMAAQAAMVPTQDVLQSSYFAMGRAGLIEKIQQQELQAQLVQMGVDPAVVVSRVQNMTDAEVLALNTKIQELPAGEGILGLIVLLFIVFIITDALGVTDVFNFVHPL